MTTIRSLPLFALAALAEIGGAWLIWQSVREHRPAWYAVLVDTFRPDRYDIAGALICLAGISVIMYSPRG